MGISIGCEKTKKSYDLGLGGFKYLREIVSSLYNQEFGKHYKTLCKGLFLSTEEKQKFYDNFDKKTLKIMNKYNLSVRVVDFCFQTDCGGSISPIACEEIYECLQGADDNIIFSYEFSMKKLKELLKECVDNKSRLYWG